MTENQNFIFSDNSFHTRGFTWAMSIHPRSEMVNNVCEACGVVKSYPAGAFDVTLEGGAKYPDILGCGAYPFLILSENVLTALQNAKVSCFHVFRVGVAEIMPKKSILQNLKPPCYYRVEIDGGCRVDLEASGLQVVKHCSKCHHLVTKPITANGFKLVRGSWDGNEMFRDHELYPRKNFCTKAILEMAKKYRFTNFRFEPLEGPWDSFSKGIPYI